MKIIGLIPAFNEEENIVDTVSSLLLSCPDVDYVVINDCSTDQTRSILRKNNFNYLDLPINLGIGGAMQTGYKYALEHEYDIAFQFDGDGQHRAEYIQDLINPIIEGDADLVIGSRFINCEGYQSSNIRRTGINILRWTIKVTTGVTIHDVTSGFRAVDKKLMTFFAQNYAQDYPEPESVVAAIVNGCKVVEVPTEMNERKKGKSSIGKTKAVYYMIKVTLAIFFYKLIGKK